MSPENTRPAALATTTAAEPIGTISVAPPTVSWLVCAHRTDEWLRQALASCLEQSFTDFELLLVANGPRYKEVATSVEAWFGHDARLRVITTPMHHLNFSLSLGLHHARGEFIARMDADDIAHPDRLARQVAFLRERQSVTVLGSAYRLIDAQGKEVGEITLPSDDTTIRRALRWRNPICHPAVMMRREPVLRVGGYLGGVHAQDHDLWLRLAAVPDWHFANLPEALLNYRQTSTGTARRSRLAYAAVAGAHFRTWVAGGGGICLLAALVAAVKAFLRSRPASRHSGD